MFYGTSSLNLDAKCRLSIPTRYRDGFVDAAITITRHPDGYLMLFLEAEWEEFRARVQNLPQSASWWKRIFLGGAHDAELDATGRVLIPADLRERVGIKKQVVLIGMGNHFELWDKDEFEHKEALALQESVPDVIKDFII